jgi:hypothetical protein
MIDPDKVADFIVDAFGRDSKQSVHQIHSAALERWPDVSYATFGAGLVLAFGKVDEARKRYLEVQFELDEVALETGRHWQDCDSLGAFLTQAAEGGNHRAKALLDSKFWLTPLLPRSGSA